MKKTERACHKFLLTLAAAAVLLLISRTGAEAATANEKTVFSFLTDTMELNPAAACGVMSNIKSESGFSPNICGLGGAYGICQWTGVRLSRLRSWCGSHGYNSTTLKGQLRFLQYELKTYYPRVNNYLKTVSNTSGGAYNAGFYWCYYFEVPADTYNTAVYRGRLAQSSYWKSMGASSLYLSPRAAGSGIRLTWNGSSTYTYQVKRSEKRNGTYQTIATISAGAKKSYTDKSAKVGKTYYYYLQPVNSKGKELTRSNKVSCTVKPSLQSDLCRITLGKTEYTYTGSVKKPKVTVYYGKQRLTLNKDYTLIYSNNKNAGTAWVRVAGKGEYVGYQKLSFTIRKAEQKIKASSLRTIMKNGFVYPKISVIGKGKVTYVSDNSAVVQVKGGKLQLKGPGVARITIKAAATANYKSASKKIELTVQPARPQLSSLTAQKGGKVQVKWTAGKKLAGFELQYTTGKTFGSSAKTVEISSGESTSARVPGLTAGKEYRFRVRTYTVVNGKNLYSNWSVVKKIKAKK